MNLEELRARKGFICDMDGVIYLGNQLLPGVAEFVTWLNENDKRFLFLTNSSERSPKELRQKLQRMGLDIGEEHFYTSALATAAFLKKQAPGCTAFVIVGETASYNGRSKELSGGERSTTNNRMELTGVISALKALKEPCIVDLVPDGLGALTALSLGNTADRADHGYRVCLPLPQKAQYFT